MKPYVPVNKVKYSLSSILPAVSSDVLDLPLQEVVRVSAFKDCEGTLRDMRCLDQLAAASEILTTRAQSLCTPEKVRDVCERKAKKVRAHMVAWSKLKGMVTTSSGSIADAAVEFDSTATHVGTL